MRLEGGGGGGGGRAVPWEGVCLNGNWRVDTKIAHGGFATVFRGANLKSGETVAIKIMHSTHSRNDEVRKRFLREGYAANKVGHPGVVKILDDAIAEDGSPFIVMELLEGGELLMDRFVARAGRMPIDEVIPICDQVLDVLAAAHDKGIVHRDIKPDNIYILADGTVKVLDFGVAHIKQSLVEHEPTRTGLVLGTPEFMAPEQAGGKPGQIDAQTDVYSVGALMFTLLSGEAVHVHDLLTALVIATATRQARSLADVTHKATLGFSPELIALVDKALLLEKEQRWASARAMQDALRAFWKTKQGKKKAAATFGSPLIDDDDLTANEDPMQTTAPMLNVKATPPTPLVHVDSSAVPSSDADTPRINTMRSSNVPSPPPFVDQPPTPRVSPTDRAKNPLMASASVASAAAPTRKVGVAPPSRPVIINVNAPSTLESVGGVVTKQPISPTALSPTFVETRRSEAGEQPPTPVVAGPPRPPPPRRMDHVLASTALSPQFKKAPSPSSPSLPLDEEVSIATDASPGNGNSGPLSPLEQQQQTARMTPLGNESRVAKKIVIPPIDPSSQQTTVPLPTVRDQHGGPIPTPRPTPTPRHPSDPYQLQEARHASPARISLGGGPPTANATPRGQQQQQQLAIPRSRTPTVRKPTTTPQPKPISMLTLVGVALLTLLVVLALGSCLLLRGR